VFDKIRHPFVIFLIFPEKMDKKGVNKGGMIVNMESSPLPNINPAVREKKVRRHRRKYSVEEYVEGILSGDRVILSQAITLLESSLPEHYEPSQEIIEKCLPYSSNSVRIGITGIPGAGKSTFIETFGLHVTGLNRKLAVLTIDPSSELSKGSILGDKTRMVLLSNHPEAFIRPSPAAGSTGGVARKTRESIILCEAAGFDTILVETVGVGQSETAVRSVVDFFLLLVVAGAGDELQGIKRGIIEMADLIAITKADGQNIAAAGEARALYQNALNLFPAKPSGWKPQAITCSAHKNVGITELWDIIVHYFELARRSGYLEEQRKQQAVIRMHDTIIEYLNSSFYRDEDVKMMLPEIESQLIKGNITSYTAAMWLLDKYFKK
jgi:LAO/AO transport system kinase